MEIIDIVMGSLISPLTLAFVLGMVATLIKSDLEFPEQVLKAISIYLIFSIGLTGGIGLSEVSLKEFMTPFFITMLVVILLPIWIYFVARKIGGFDIENSAGITALYASVSSVTFITALSFAKNMDTEAESFMPSLVSFMELTILVTLLIARVALGKKAGEKLSYKEMILDILRGRSFVLLIGGLTMGYLIGPTGFSAVKPVFEDAFKGILVLFLLEMGMVAAKQLKDFVKAGKFMLAFGILMPLIHGALGTFLGTVAGLSVGGAFVFGAILASSSYIDAPAVVRATFPKANPSIYLTSSLGITFPFNIVIGLPIYYEMATYFEKLIG